jgi:DNA-binding transcriptional ArsR family regulator
MIVAMDTSEPHAAICPTLDGPVLMVLAATTRPLAAREVSRLVRRGSWGGVRKALLRLAEHGIVTVQEAANVTLYTLNRQHLAAPAVEVLAGLRQELTRRLSQDIGSWTTPPVHASLFGSAARSDGTTTSDIDLFIVRPRTVNQEDPRWRSQLDQLAANVLAWTGNHTGISEVSETDLGRVRRTPAGKSIRADGITLAGKRVDEIFGRAA